MSSCEELTSSTDATLTCPTSTDLQEDMSSSNLALFAASELPSSSHNDATNVATTALHLECYASELLLWLQRSDAMSPADEAFFFFETRHPELLDDLPLLFTWLSLFLAQHEDSSNVEAMQQLDSSGNVSAIAEEFALKSALTLLYWKYEDERHQLTEQRVDTVGTDTSSKARTVFQDEKGLLKWVLERRQVSLTRQDIINHVLEEYPIFAASKSAAALKVWTSRFLKKHIQPQPSLVSAAEAVVSKVMDVTQVADETELAAVEAHKGVEVESTTSAPTMLLPQSQSADDTQEEVADTESRSITTIVRHTGKRRSCSGRYTLFSNEFKLHAVNMLEEGKSIAEVAKEVGLKNSNCLNYWKSIRDKLVTSERKRFRLAGGGRRSSCTFEDELLTWVSQRHQRGQGTDVKAVLEYMRQHHSSFTEGKKEPTLRKWILRFFKRCWRAPFTSMDSQDAEKAYIFV
ncbi:hypothetical protein KXD40_005930 [Peronospora effusa]|uniref:Uncharacterized protein n=1 Tax=Peronospora effusa TaxID=542832 RepID=A0A425CIH2_9STRA|nr:hypothetical protein DD237_002483 [Peronospora effusa]UIZ27533.1 hypothetical protein KXD40_005930 [Peronospora effusa]